MNEDEELIFDQFINGHKYFYNNIAIDAVIFGYHDKTLKVLLQKPQDILKWGLCGGYVFKNESIDDAAKRTVKNRTGIENLQLYQFKTFGDKGRNKDDSFTPDSLSKIAGVKIKKNHWLFEDFISISYFTLTEYSLVEPTGDYYREECYWWGIDSLPEMIQDHAKIITQALKALKLFAYHHPIGFELLPSKFTLPEIHALYETVLNKEIDIRNFQKKMTSIGLLIKLDEQKDVAGHRRPFLYTFDKEVYDQMIRDEEVIVF